MRLSFFALVLSLLVPPINAQSWSATARSHRDSNAQFVYHCPADGTAYGVWGTDNYTDDSSVCTAAVHAGLITLASGGSVTILMKGGGSAYESSTRNGIASRSWGPWGGSFEFVGSNARPRPSSEYEQTATWATTMSSHRGNLGRHVEVTCPGGGTARGVWGDGPYTDDSSVCTAGVHAGAITLASGGTFTVEITGRHESYATSTRNGITSRSWGPWNGSFRVLD